jgi:hypothetical protein
LVVTRLDRLARSTRDLLNILDAVGKAGAGFKSLKDTWADTTTPHGRLMLTVLGGLAEFERELIRARTDDGRKQAKARGVRFGRPLKLTAHQRKEAIRRLAEGAVQADLAAPMASARQPSVAHHSPVCDGSVGVFRPRPPPRRPMRNRDYCILVLSTAAPAEHPFRFMVLAISSPRSGVRG